MSPVGSGVVLLGPPAVEALSLDKLEEELGEIREALSAGDRDHAATEVGDLLFATVNLARTLGVDPEACLRGTNQRFESRFRHMERSLEAQDTPLGRASLERMEEHWQQAKRAERAEPSDPFDPTMD